MIKNQITVLDFGSEKISAMLAEKGVNNSLNILGTGEVNYAGFYNGKFLEENDLKVAISSSINELEKSTKTETNFLYVGVPAAFCFVKTTSATLNFKKEKTVTFADVDEICELAIAGKKTDDLTLINRSSVYFIMADNRRLINPINERTSRLSANISFIYAENYFLNKVSQILREIGILNFEFICSTLATSLYLLDDEQRAVNSVIIDIGYITSSVALVRGEGLLALSSFDNGGGNITADLAECLSIKFKEAEILKQKIMLNVEPLATDVYEITTKDKTIPIEAKMANEIVMARLEVIAKNISKALQAFSFEIPAATKFYLTGGGISYIQGAVDFMSKNLSKNIELLKNPSLEHRRPHYSSILGLFNMANYLNEMKRK